MLSLHRVLLLSLHRVLLTSLHRVLLMSTWCMLRSERLNAETALRLNSIMIGVLFLRMILQMAKYPSQFAKDACVLSDKFSQALYGIWTEIGEPSRDFEFSDTVIEYASEVRPQQGRDQSNCSKFYIPVNVRGKNHWILAVVEVVTQRVVVNDSIPWVTGSREELEHHMIPYTKIFPLILQRTGKFERYKEKFGHDLKLVITLGTIIPINDQT